MDKNSPGAASMNALAGASVGAADIDRPITAAAAPFERKDRRLCVEGRSPSPLEADAETAERWLRRDGRATIAFDVDGVETDLDDAGSLSIAEEAILILSSKC